jgi:hypothetical protein
MRHVKRSGAPRPLRRLWGCASILAVLGAIAARAAETPQPANRYLEIPITGRLGRDVPPETIDRILQRASEQRVPHIVFLVDCVEGDHAATLSINAILERYEPRFTYIAVVHNAIGEGVLFPLRSRIRLVRPGSNLGGADLTLAWDAISAGVDPDVLRSNVVLNAEAIARRHGWDPLVVRAMIEPEAPLVAWRDPSGVVRFGAKAPGGVTPLFRKPEGRVLVLTGEQAVALGLARPINAPVDRLGEILGLPGWASAGDDGRRALAEARSKQENAAKRLAADLQSRERDRVASQRETAKRAMDYFLQKADEWDPRRGTYTTQGGDGWWYGWGDAMNRLSPESREEWRFRTDLTMDALARASQAASRLAELEKEAERLGLPRLVPQETLDSVRNDSAVRIQILDINRDQRHLGAWDSRDRRAGAERPTDAR